MNEETELFDEETSKFNELLRLFLMIEMKNRFFDLIEI